MALKRKSLKRVFLLRAEIRSFCITKHDIYYRFSDNSFHLSLSFLVGIFESVNSINLGLRGNEITILDFHDKLIAFQMKIYYRARS